MGFSSTLVLVTLALFGGMMLLLEVGRRSGRRGRAAEPDKAHSAVEGSVFALMGLLIAFTFSGAVSRFEGRRELVTKEYNALSTAWRLFDVLPPRAREEARAQARAYLDARLSAYAALPDAEAARAELARAIPPEQALWDCVTGEAQSGSPPVRTVLSALGELSNVAATRTQATERHPPLILFALLVFLALVCSLLAGLTMGSSERRPLLHMLVFAAVVSATVGVILDFEYPRLGWIRVDSADQALVELRAAMDEQPGG